MVLDFSQNGISVIFEISDDRKVALKNFPLGVRGQLFPIFHLKLLDSNMFHLLHIQG